MERHSKKQKRSWPEDQRIIRTYLLPAFKNTRAADVSRAEVCVMLERIADGAPIQANRVLALLRKIYNWGIGCDIVAMNPCAQIPRPAQENRRDRVLSEDEIKLAWKAFYTLGPLMSAMFKLRLLTAQRGGEISGMEWAEVDLEGAWWTIPAEKAKNGLAHRVPLSTSAVRILESLREHQSELKNELKKRSKFVFYAPRGDGHVEEVQKAVQRIRAAMVEWTGAEEGTGIDFTAHDLRRTAASMMTSIGIPRLVVARILNHAETGVTAVYDRHSYDAEKKDALERWAKRLMNITSDLKVAAARAAGPDTTSA